jgi:hypothetical protein
MDFSLEQTSFDYIVNDARVDKPSPMDLGG